MPVNTANQLKAAAKNAGGGMNTNVYTDGFFDLAEDGALSVEISDSGEPVYTRIYIV
jgi:acyl-CoA hydrolase